MKVLKIAGIVTLQFIVGVIVLMAVIWVCTSAEMHYAGNSNYETMVEVADTPAEIEKEGGEE